MSTRGFVGFKTNNTTAKENIFGVYNHYDSYYSDLGIKILSIYKNTNADYFKRIFNSIKWTNLDDETTSLDAIPLFKDGYKNQEIFNNYRFLYNGLFCEYGYLYNLEEDSLELYRGLFLKPQSEEISKYGCRAYDGTTYHTHKVYTITRDSDFNKIEDMFKTLQINKDARTIVNDKYIEDIFMEK